MVQLVSAEKYRSPMDSGKVRLEGAVKFDNGNTTRVWFDIPSAFDSYISERGEPWAILLLPCAAMAGEDLRIDLPVDPLLLDNLKAVQKIWMDWYDWVGPVSMTAREEPDKVARDGSAVFFSGGVDSYYSLIRTRDFARKGSRPRDVHLVTLCGFDNPLLTRTHDLQRVVSLGDECAKRFGCQFIPVATNLRELNGYDGRHFDQMTHSAALATIGHVLSRGIQDVMIGSTHELTSLVPWGSHPLVDPLFSSAATSIVHDGAAATRVDKTETICNVPEALDALRVCTRWRGTENCSECEKCLRTMVTLDLCGKKDSARAFDWSEYSLERVAKIYLSDRNEMSFAHEIRDAARERGRMDIANAVEKSIGRSKRIARIDQHLSKLKNVPWTWRIRTSLRRVALGYH